VLLAVPYAYPHYQEYPISPKPLNLERGQSKDSHVIGKLKIEPKPLKKFKISDEIDN
jgi:hypothetical protein